MDSCDSHSLVSGIKSLLLEEKGHLIRRRSRHLPLKGKALDSWDNHSLVAGIKSLLLEEKGDREAVDEVGEKDDPKLLAIELTAPAVLQITRSDRQPHFDKEYPDNVNEITHFSVIHRDDMKQ